MTLTIRAAMLVCCLAAAFWSAACGGNAPYPSRPITLIVPWGAGGGTDAVARAIATALERELGQPVNVVNRTGGSGVVGHQAIATAAPDGYTIGMITVEIAMMHHQGLTDLTPASFTPLGLINFDATGVQVRADAPYRTLGELMDAIRSSPPGTLKASGTAHGGIWHVSLYGLLDEQGIDPSSVPWVPSVSSAAGLLDLVAGGVELVTASHPEARSLIDAGRVRSLAVLDRERSALYPDVPTGREAIGTEWEMGVWRGIAAPPNLPDDVRTRLESALEAAYASDEYREFMTSRGFGMRWMGPADFAAFMAEADAQMGAAMQKVGLAR
ncbi:MAG: tripartite tricarboxylate transporter substrate binding protein [Acidobacteriota bacterium]|jgi:tripartite-type tricarboxylate transporter receptor subunit TctC|nr:MAG: tripartite tricarboxylate transporter substrate-binding protein [Acidobacteriota bacterium]